MPLAALIGPALSVGASLLGASSAKKAANATNAANQQAARESLAAQQANFDRIVGLNQPYIQGGNTAQAALMARLGLSAPSQPSNPWTMRPPGTPPAGSTPTMMPMNDRPMPTGAPMGGQGQGGLGGGGPPPGAVFSADTFMPTGADRRAADGVGGAAGMDFANARGSADDFGSGGRTGQPAPMPAYTGDARIPGEPTPQGGGQDFAGYLQANPDVAAWAQQSIGQTPPNWEGGVIDSPEEAAAYHYQAHGQGEGRTLNAAAPDPNAVPDYMNMRRPEAPEAPTFERPAAMQAPSLQGFIDPAKFQVDPGYQFRLSEGLKAVNAASAARGKLRSGDAAMALQARGEGLANQGYGDWYQRQLQAFDRTNSQFQYGQGRADNVFADDRAYGTARYVDQRGYGDNRFDAERGYQTDRYDQQNANLFNLTNVGRGAAGQVAGAGTTFANNASNIYGDQAASTGARANARSVANQQLYGAVAGAAGNAFANWGGGIGRTTPTNPQTVGDAWNSSFGGGWQTAANPGPLRTMGVF
jgi:hypothetical protein